jgi:hypothetical protein
MKVLKKSKNMNGEGMWKSTQKNDHLFILIFPVCKIVKKFCIINNIILSKINLDQKMYYQCQLHQISFSQKSLKVSEKLAQIATDFSYICYNVSECGSIYISYLFKAQSVDNVTDCVNPFSITLSLRMVVPCT